MKIEITISSNCHWHLERLMKKTGCDLSATMTTAFAVLDSILDGHPTDKADVETVLRQNKRESTKP